MQVILLDKVANPAARVIKLTLKRATLVTSRYHRAKLFLLPRKTLSSSKHAVLNWKPNWLTFWLLLKLAQPRSTNWVQSPSLPNLATKVNCSALSAPATSLTQ